MSSQDQQAITAQQSAISGEIIVNEPGWKTLVTRGYVWNARLNRLTVVGSVALALFVLSVTRDIHGNTIGVAERLADPQQSATWLERFKTAPINTVMASIKGISGSSETERPEIDKNALVMLMPVPATAAFSPETLTKPADLKAYLDDNVKALNATGKLSADYPACDKLDDLRKPWVNKKTGLPDIPRCLVSASGDTIWMASIVSDGGTYMVSPAPWLGVFHKDKASNKWAYYNTQIVGAARLQLNGYKAITVDMIPYQFASDFPYLVTKKTTEEKTQ